MNDLYNETIERKGKIYHYDPDHDVYYSRLIPMNSFDRYGWLVVIAVLTSIAIYFEFYPLR
jgi:hypothetical protein